MSIFSRWPSHIDISTLGKIIGNVGLFSCRLPNHDTVWVNYSHRRIVTPKKWTNGGVSYGVFTIMIIGLIYIQKYVSSAEITLQIFYKTLPSFHNIYYCKQLVEISVRKQNTHCVKLHSEKLRCCIYRNSIRQLGPFYKQRLFKSALRLWHA